MPVGYVSSTILAAVLREKETLFNHPLNQSLGRWLVVRVGQHVPRDPRGQDLVELVPLILVAVWRAACLGKG